MTQEFISQELFDKIGQRINEWRTLNMHLTDEQAIEKLKKLFENSELILEYMEAKK